MNKLITSIKTKHVNYEVLTAAILHLSEAEQVKVNNLITRSLGLPVHATAGSIQRERQIKVDECAEYDGILDAFRVLERVVKAFRCGEICDHETLADAQMLIASIQDDR